MTHTHKHTNIQSELNIKFKFEYFPNYLSQLLNFDIEYSGSKGGWRRKGKSKEWGGGGEEEQKSVNGVKRGVKYERRAGEEIRETGAKGGTRKGKEREGGGSLEIKY